MMTYWCLRRQAQVIVLLIGWYSTAPGYNRNGQLHKPRRWQALVLDNNSLEDWELSTVEETPTLDDYEGRPC
jgi:hypothetical protein